MPDVCLFFVLLFTIFIIVVTQKLVLQQSKNVTAKCMENLSPPPCVLYLLAWNHTYPYNSLLRPWALSLNPCLWSVIAPVYIYTCILSKVFCTNPDLPLTPGGGWRMSKSSSSNLWSPDVSGVALQPPQSTEKAVEEEQSVSAIDPFTSCNSYRWNVRV